MSKTRKKTAFNTLYNRIGFDKNDIARIEYTESITEYNTDGKITKETIYTEDSEIESYTLNEYDNNGRLLSSTQFDADDILCQQTTMQYDEENHLLCQGNIYGEGSPEYLTKFTYENGLLTRQDSYNEDEFDYTEKAFAYDAEGRLIKETDYADDGEELYIIENQYNEQSQLSQVVRHEIAAKDRRTYLFEYDERGNKTKDLIYNFNEELIAKIYHTFNNDNLPVEIESEDLDRYQKLTYTYEGKLPIEEQLTDKEGNILARTQYQYNSYGDLLKTTRYIRDEVNNNELRILSETLYEREYYE